MNSDSSIILYIIGYGLAFIIGVFITRAIFSIPKFLNLQEAQLQILTEIAKQQGIKDEILNSIYTNCSVNLRLKTNEEIRAELKKSQTTTDKSLEKEAMSYPKE